MRLYISNITVFLNKLQIPNSLKDLLSIVYNDL